jgi:Xaa-Pro aminopeptidase
MDEPNNAAAVGTALQTRSTGEAASATASGNGVDYDRTLHARRRQAARQRMGEGVLVLFGAPEFIRNNDVTHEYRQDSDFYYLTGLEEQECVLVLVAGESESFTLFVRPRNKEREIWDGVRTGVEGAVSKFGATAAYPIEELGKRLPELLKGHERLFYRFGVHSEQDSRLIAALGRCRALARRTGRAPTQLIDSATVLHEMRLRKQPEELQLMRRAIEITGRAHLAAMRAARPGCYEYELEAELTRVFRQSGSARAAYKSIVGSGPNATILHHVLNDRRTCDGDLVLIDAGCELDYYASDITRVFPVNGRFTPEQRVIYEIVLGAQRAAFEAILPGATLDDVHAASLRHITLGLIEHGLIRGPLELALSEERYKPFFMHRTSHFLGMDVHDVANEYAHAGALALEPSMVITVEPGVYIAVDNADVPPAFRGIGIRIEDDVLVTVDGYENLSQGIPKSIAEIEALMSGSR